MAIPIVGSSLSGSGTPGILPIWSTGTVLADSKIQDGIATGILTVAKAGVTARTATFPDAAVLVTGSAAALTSGRLPKGTATAGVATDSQIADGVTGNILTIAGTLTALRTVTVPDKSGTLAMTSDLANGFGWNRTLLEPSAPGARIGGYTWATNSMPAASTNWRSVAYGNGIWVAVTNAVAAAASSPDGITWTARTMPSAAQWECVTYGNGVFVAVAPGPSTSAAYSVDGINWTASTLPSSAGWRTVTYGNGTFVTVADASSIAATSPDGITWTQRVLPSSAAWYRVAYGNGLFVAVVNSSVTAATSTDGVTWTARTLPSAVAWQSLIYGNGVFLVIARSLTTAATSADGVNWVSRTLPSAANWTSVTYGNGLFIAVSDMTSVSGATSTDGITWTARTIPSGNWISIAYGNGIFVSVSPSTNISMISGGALTFAGDFTASRTKTLQNTTATLAELETAQTFTLAQTFSTTAIFNANLIIGTGGTYTAGSIYSDASWGMLFRAKAATPSGAEFRWSKSDDVELMRLDSNANLGVGVTPVASNGLVQLASGTTKANGIAFGTDTFLYRNGANSLITGGSIQATDLASVIGVTGNQQLFTIGVSSTQRWTLVRDTANRLITYVDMTGVGGSAGAIQTALSTGETGFGVTPTASNGLVQLASGTTAASGYACGTDTHWYRDSAGSWSADSNIKVATVGKGLYVKEGTNATMGSATMVAGAVVVSTTKITATSRVFLTSQADGGTVGFLRVSTRTAATSFAITSSSAADTSTVAWIIMEPA